MEEVLRIVDKLRLHRDAVLNAKVEESPYYRQPLPGMRWRLLHFNFDELHRDCEFVAMKVASLPDDAIKATFP